jgi:hypothetical protein
MEQVCRISAKDAAMLATEFFAQSVIKTTPPTGDVMKNRTVFEIADTLASGYRRRRYRVPYRSSRKKGVQYFALRGDAKAFSKIRYRYIGKYGWFLAAQKVLGRPPKVRMPKIGESVTTKANEIFDASTTTSRYGPQRWAVLENKLVNRVYNIRKYALYATRTALARTNIRLGQAMKAEVRKMGRRWDAS